jgi:shikimate dehydrogenase
MDQRLPVIRLAVFGSPISHSRSPVIHGLFADQCGLNVDYRAIEATGENFAGLLDDLAARGGRGCNVTVPLKSKAWELAHRSSVSAQRAQAANILVFEGPGDWFADNTDGRGLVQDLVGNIGQELNGARICIVGAGGAAAGILGDLLACAPARVVIANRTLQRAKELQQLFGTEVSVISLGDLCTTGPFDLVINATSLGHGGRHPELPSTMFLPGSLCYDLNYGAAAKPLRTYCRNAGMDYQDGLGMLVEQAALSFELWTGQGPATKPVLKALRDT